MTTTREKLIQPFANRKVPAFGYAHLARRAASDGTQAKELLTIAQPGMRLGVDEKQQCATFVVTSDTPDRVGDVVDTPGIVLTSFVHNPIALLNHGALVWPIGKWATYDDDICTIVKEQRRTLGTLYYSRRTPEGVQAFILTAEGIFKSVSIGFNPLAEPQLRHPGEHNPNSLQQGYRFPKVDLIEISLCCVPAQPEATLVRRYLSAGKIGGEPIAPMLRKSLELMSEPAPAWANGASLPDEGETMSKKWRKAPRDKPRVDKGASPEERGKALIASISKEAKDALQECVSRKIPKIAEDHPEMSQDQRVAVAFSMCGEESKAMSESDGAAGGYTVPGGEEKDELKPYGDEDPQKKDAAPAVTKAPPPPGAARGEEDVDDEGEQPVPPPDAAPPPLDAGKPDPKEVLSRLVDALTDYLDVTGAAKPDAPPPAAELPGEDEDGEEEEDDFDLDMDAESNPPRPEDDEDEDEEDEERLERYQLRAGKPLVTKGVLHDGITTMRKAIHKAALHCKAMSEVKPGEFDGEHAALAAYHHKALMGVCKALDAAGLGEEKPEEKPEEEMPKEPADKPAAAEKPDKPDLPYEEKGLDLAAIQKALAPINNRLDGIGKVWQQLNGAMPQ